MKKTVIFFALIFILIVFAFFPFKKQQSVLIKGTFFNVYQRLAKPVYWQQWMPELKHLQASDKAKIVATGKVDGFDLVSNKINLSVKINGYNFLISEGEGSRKYSYAYTVLPQKKEDETLILVDEKTNLISQLLAFFNSKQVDGSHINDFKYFMETPRLYYGFDIIKKHVIDTGILVLTKIVLAKNKFDEAGKSLVLLKKYAFTNGLKQAQPVMAQFLTKQNDSIEVKIGLPVDKKVKNKGDIQFVRMPATGYMYTAKFHGQFKDRNKVFSAVQSYFSDRRMPMPILPFEIYLNNKLPTSETDTVSIQLNCSTF